MPVRKISNPFRSSSTLFTIEGWQGWQWEEEAVDHLLEKDKQKEKDVISKTLQSKTSQLPSVMTHETQGQGWQHCPAVLSLARAGGTDHLQLGCVNGHFSWSGGEVVLVNAGHFNQYNVTKSIVYQYPFWYLSSSSPACRVTIMENRTCHYVSLKYNQLQESVSAFLQRLNQEETQST